MEYTSNYQLPLWEKDDPVLRTDFNDNNSQIDAAIKAVEQNAESAAAEAKTQAANALAAYKSTNNAAVAALQSAVNAERITVGSYTGDGTDKQTIPLPFTPRVVLLFTQFGGSTVYERLYVLTNVFHFAVSESTIGFTTIDECALLENGLQVGGTTTNYEGKVNHYIAMQ